MTRRQPHQRLLEGLVVGISISESSDSKDLGYSTSEINHATVRIAETLLSEGAHLVFGHNWRRDGVMTEIHRLAVTYQATDHPVITNLLPWPDEPGLTPAERAEAARTLEIREARLPPDVRKYETNPKKRADPWLRARALTWMRRQIVATVGAQICLGGRTEGSSGRFPGVVEEAYFVSLARKPLYLSGLLGGATREMIGAIRRQKFSEAILSTKDSVRQAFANALATTDDPDAKLNHESLASHFQSHLTMANLCKKNRLTPSENKLLCDAVNLEQALTPLLCGLSRVHQARTG